MTRFTGTSIRSFVAMFAVLTLCRKYFGVLVKADVSTVKRLRHKKKQCGAKPRASDDQAHENRQPDRQKHSTTAATIINHDEVKMHDETVQVAPVRSYLKLHRSTSSEWHKLQSWHSTFVSMSTLSMVLLSTHHSSRTQLVLCANLCSVCPYQIAKMLLDDTKKCSIAERDGGPYHVCCVLLMR